MDKQQKRRKQILTEMAQIEQMEKGSFTAEYRQTVREGKTVQLGPYYKHQLWENGRNLSRRVPAREAGALQQAVEGYQRYQALSEEYAEITIQMTRKGTGSPHAKKKPR